MDWCDHLRPHRSHRRVAGGAGGAHDFERAVERAGAADRHSRTQRCTSSTTTRRPAGSATSSSSRRAAPPAESAISILRVKGNVLREGHAGAGRRARRAAADGRREGPARVGRAGRQAVRRVVVDLRAPVAAREHRVPVERRERAGERRRSNTKGALPDILTYVVGHGRGRERALQPGARPAWPARVRHAAARSRRLFMSAIRATRRSPTSGSTPGRSTRLRARRG